MGENGFILLKAWKKNQDVYSDHRCAEARTYGDGELGAWVSMETRGVSQLCGNGRRHAPESKMAAPCEET